MKTLVKKTEDGSILIFEISTLDILNHFKPSRLNMVCMLIQRLLREEGLFSFKDNRFEAGNWNFVHTAQLLNTMYPEVFTRFKYESEGMIHDPIMSHEWFTHTGWTNYYSPMTRDHQSGFRHPLFKAVYNEFGNRTVRVKVHRGQVEIERI